MVSSVTVVNTPRVNNRHDVKKKKKKKHVIRRRQSLPGCECVCQESVCLCWTDLVLSQYASVLAPMMTWLLSMNADL